MSAFEVTIISSRPHMHLQGRHLKTVINRRQLLQLLRSTGL
jgi:hypothetical protein